MTNLTLSNGQSITTTDFDHNYHSSQKHSSNFVSEYVLHNLDVYNEVMGMSAVYQAGQSYIHGDYSTPSAKLELSEDGGADGRLIKINNLYEADFDDETCSEYLQEMVGDLEIEGINTVSDLRNLYLELMDNNSLAQQYADNLDIEPVFLSDEPDFTDAPDHSDIY